MKSAKYNLNKYVYTLAGKPLHKTTLAEINKIVTLIHALKNQAARKIQRKFRNRRRT